MPGARGDHAIAQGSDGLIRIFGGEGLGAAPPDQPVAPGALNDLWTWDNASGQMTWIAGSPLINQPAISGPAGLSNPSNAPSGRAAAALWVDNAGNTWLFGGRGHNIDGYSDLWKMDKASGNWSLISGPLTEMELPRHGTRNVPSAANTPGARVGSASWTDAQGNLWLFGGESAWFDPDYNSTYRAPFSDLWKYDTLTNLWVWVAGPKEHDKPGVYGVKDQASSSSNPGARYKSASWRDQHGDLWLFGGDGYDSEAQPGTLGDLWKYNISAGQWTWVSGSKRSYYFGSFGTRRVAAPSNEPESLSAPAGWADPDGNFWVFGGLGYPQSKNVLWKFNPATRMWTWMSGSKAESPLGHYGTKGQPSQENFPGARNGSVGWADSAGNVYVFGGVNYLTRGSYNDLWRYNEADDTWVWLGGGSENYYANRGATPGSPALPGALYGGVTWEDKLGNFYLFGGNGYNVDAFGAADNLWKYNVQDGKWTWLRGATSDFTGQPVFGQQNVSAPANTPGTRTGSMGWTGSDNKLWLFGGAVRFSPLIQLNTNDLWRYNPANTTWTWVKGPLDPQDTSAVYGQLNVPSVSNYPGGRENGMSYTDDEENLWLFGGRGRSDAGFGLLNDLWKYNLTTNQWTWVGGAKGPNEPGAYVEKGSPSEWAKPGARMSAVSWADGQGNLWLFGGFGRDALAFSGPLNDLWKYNKSTGLWAWMRGSDLGNASGNYGVRGVSHPDNDPPARIGATGWMGKDGRLWLFGGAVTDNLFDKKSLNDLWCYDPQSNQWTWISGEDELRAKAIYGSLGIAAPTNTPGARVQAHGWQDLNGNLWLFGGDGYGTIEDATQQDLWMFETGTGPSHPTAARDWSLYQ